tara:strand:- start:453 stop:602 length:150 start_codon:yes stop_codon:yes gene_type:complete
MVGKVKKSVKKKTVKKSADNPMTLEEKLSDVKERMNTIVEGADPMYHLK